MIHERLRSALRYFAALAIAATTVLFPWRPAACLAGTLWSWGGNISGQLGDGTFDDSSIPVRVSGLYGVDDLYAAGEHSLAITRDGRVWSWGEIRRGQPGDASSCLPSPVDGIPPALALAGGFYSSLVLAALPGGDTGLWAWGENQSGDLGDGTILKRETPVRVVDPTDASGFLTGIEAIASGEETHFALIRGGAGTTLKAWGLNISGQIGNGTTADQWVPVPVADPSDPSGLLTAVVAVSAGDRHAIALKSDGTVRAWGDNSHGQLGNGTWTGSTLPVQVTDPGDPSGYLRDVTAIASGATHNLALKSDGTVWGWGYDFSEAYCDGNWCAYHPAQILDLEDPSEFLSGVIEISSKGKFDIALKSDGTVRTWGANSRGYLGNGDTRFQPLPVQVVNPLDPTGFLQDIWGVTCGDRHCMALTSGIQVTGIYLSSDLCCGGAPNHADATVSDQHGFPAPEATVWGHWEGQTLEQVQGISGPDGTVHFDTQVFPDIEGKVCFVIDNVELEGFEFDPGAGVSVSCGNYSGSDGCVDRHCRRHCEKHRENHSGKHCCRHGNKHDGKKYNISPGQGH